MRVLYSLIKQLPSSMLFHRATRLQLDGVSWAPASLLNNHNFYSYASGSPPATCDVQGLHVRFFGYVVEKSQRLEENQASLIYFKEPEEAQLSGRIGPLSATTVHFSADQMKKNPFGLAEVTKFDRLIRGTKKPEIIFNPEDPGESALVSISRDEGGIIYGKFLIKIFTRIEHKFRPD